MFVGGLRKFVLAQISRYTVPLAASSKDYAWHTHWQWGYFSIYGKGKGFSQLPLVVATAHAYYNVQYGRILHSSSMEHLYYANLEIE